MTSKEIGIGVTAEMYRPYNKTDVNVKEMFVGTPESLRKHLDEIHGIRDCEGDMQWKPSFDEQVEAAKKAGRQFTVLVHTDIEWGTAFMSGKAVMLLEEEPE